MKSVFSLALLGSALPALAAAQEVVPPPSVPELAVPLTDRHALPLLSQRNCRDTIAQVRAERGLPLIQRDVADPDEPILFSALDYDIDGCDVLLTATGPRPLPRIEENAPLIRRAQ